MGSKKIILLPKERKILQVFGENIKLSRLRRKLSTNQLAERAGIGRTTIYHIERGSPGVSIGYHLKVLSVLGLSEDILTIAKDDVLGRKIQDAELTVAKRAPKKNN